MLQEKAPRSIKTQLLLLNDLTNPQEQAPAFGMTINTNPCTTRSFPHKRLKISTTKYSKDTSNLDLTREHARQGLASTTSHLKRKHATTKTSRTQHRNAHLHWLDGLTNPQERARHRADDQQKPLHDPNWFPRKPKDSNTQIFQGILKLALTREHARQSIASRTSRHQR